MALLTQQEKMAVKTFKQRVQEEFENQVLLFRLFGSRARGEGDEASDVDILVLMQEAPARVRGQIFAIASDIFLEYEIEISPLVMSKKHFEEMKKRERLLPQDIERDGQTI